MFVCVTLCFRYSLHIVGLSVTLQNNPIAALYFQIIHVMVNQLTNLIHGTELFLGSQQILSSCFSYKPNVHQHIHSSPTLVNILSQMNLAHETHVTSLISTLTLSFHLHLAFPRGIFLSGFLTKTFYVFFFSPI